MKLSKLVNKVLFIVNLLLIVGLLLSYLSVHVSPETIGILPLFGLSYPLLLFSNFLFLLYWLWRWNRYFLYPLIALLIGLPIFSNVFQLPRKSKELASVENTQQFKVLSYNVRLFNLYDWAQNKEAGTQILDFIKEEKPGIVCFQEFYIKHDSKINLPFLQRSLSNNPYVHIVPSKEGTSGFYGIATFSKYPIVNRGEIHFKNTTNISIYTDIKVGADTLRVFNNHLQSIRFNQKNYSFIQNSKDFKEEERIEEIKDISFRLLDAFKKRANQADILATYIEESPYKVVVCGDFNDTPVSYTYKTMKGNLKDAFHSYGRWFGNTYLGNFPSYRIDYILYNEKLELLDYNVPKRKLSDHYPIVGIFRKPH